jgi:hypothetical protein
MAYNHTQKNDKQRGSAVQLVIIIVLVLGLLGVVGYIAWSTLNKKNTNDTKSNQTASQQTTALGVSPKTYTAAEGSFSVQYPNDWQLTGPDSTSNSAYTYTSLTSPNGAVLHLDVRHGGTGGTCVPSEKDVPFASGNSCTSIEYLSSDAFSNTEKYQNLAITTFKYGATDGATSYTLGVSSLMKPSELNTPQMGLFTTSTSFSNPTDTTGTYFLIYANSKDAHFLTSDDANTIRKIIKSFTVS